MSCTKSRFSLSPVRDGSECHYRAHCLTINGRVRDFYRRTHASTN